MELPLVAPGAMTSASPPGASFRWTENEVVRALGLPAGNGENHTFGRISTDSRMLSAGDLFVALRGSSVDGHDFLDQAASSGATGAVVQRVPAGAPRSLRYFEVHDTRAALVALARHRRQRLQARVVAVVGSNGKTTTKELIRAALTPLYRVHATVGNENNQIGVPLTLLAAPDDTEVLVVEMGTNAPREIALLADLVRPHAAVITSIGEEHLEKLKNTEGVLQEETAVIAALADNGLGFIAEEPPCLLVRASKALTRERTRIAGFSDAADLRPDHGNDGVHLQPDGTTTWQWRGLPVRTPLPGRWNVRNALLALGLAECWGVTAEYAVRAIREVSSPPLRMEWKTIGTHRVLADCYNSNPASFQAAIELFAELASTGAKVAVLGTMHELGAVSELLHERCAALVADCAVRELDLVVATGAFARAFEPFVTSMGNRLVRCTDLIDAYHLVRPRLEGGETFLLKASRGEALERWVDLLRADFTRKQ